MPAGVAPKTFHGNKNSGRKSARDEFLRNRVIEKAWLLKDVKLADNEAIQIVLKDMTNKTDITSLGESIKPIYSGLSVKKDE